MVLFVGYQSVGTLGRLLVDGAEKVKLFGDEIVVKAEINTLPGVSGHADKDGLIAWLKGFEEKPRMVFVNHGDPECADSFTACLNDELGYRAYAPYSGSSYDLLADAPAKITEGIPIVKENKGRSVSPAFTRLTAAAERLLRTAKTLEGRANKELNRYSDQIEEIIGKMQK